jgi:hypothetical protein
MLGEKDCHQLTKLLTKVAFVPNETPEWLTVVPDGKRGGD